MAVPAWLSDAVLYQIYPQSFADSNGDGIGDLNGIESKLDYLAWLGVNTVWLNPCFSSPMRDAGYDVADYYAIDPRYGSRDDLAKLVDSASRKGIRVLLDLVAGHTSDQHEWFVRSADDPSDDRYVWAAEQAPGFEPSPGRREGFYLPNFFPVQPALNFGYGRMNEAEPWRQPVDAPGPRANRQALRDIMDYWLRTGVAGFRVDMAASLVNHGAIDGEMFNEANGEHLLVFAKLQPFLTEYRTKTSSPKYLAALEKLVMTNQVLVDRLAVIRARFNIPAPAAKG